MNMKSLRFAVTCAVALGAALPALAQTPGPADTGLTPSGPMPNASAPSSSMSPAPGGTKIYNISAQNGSNETGTVTLGSQGANKTVVSVDLQGGPAGDLEPAHIHKGTCATLDPAPAYPLNNITAGHSRTVVNVPMSSLIAGGFAVNVHKSLSDLKDYVACGDLTPANAAASSANPQPTATVKGGR